MNNKELGNSFEGEVCAILSNSEYWVHFITPDARGAQPFDIIAVKNKIAYAIECKTLSFRRRYFTIDRLEENQILAFNRWSRCNNGDGIIAVKQGNDILSFKYKDLKKNDKIDIYAMKDQESVVCNIKNKENEIVTFKIYGILKDML